MLAMKLFKPVFLRRLILETLRKEPKGDRKVLSSEYLGIYHSVTY